MPQHDVVLLSNDGPRGPGTLACGAPCTTVGLLSLIVDAESLIVSENSNACNCRCQMDVPFKHHLISAHYTLSGICWLAIKLNLADPSTMLVQIPSQIPTH